VLYKKRYKNTYVKEVNADEKYSPFPYNLIQLVNPKAVIKEQSPSIKNVVGITYWRGNPDHEKRYFGVRRSTALSPS